MSEEDKPKQPQEPESEEPPAPEAEEKDTPTSSEPSSEPAASDKPESEEAVSEKPAKPAKPAPKAAKKKGLAYEDLEDDALLNRLKEKFSEGISSGQSFLNQPTYTVSLDCLYDVMLELKDNPDWDFDYLIDLTALDYLEDEKRFCMVYHLYSYEHGKLIRVKARTAEDEAVPSMSSLWKTADWMEREVYDLFGIEFSGHDDLKRILLPDDWHGHPLRKDYDIKLQDQAWIKKHLHIRKTPA
jgi:NADH-quinone oxidoreductase subunit C